MDFSLSMEQKILRDSVRAFAEKEIKPVAQRLDETETFSYDLTRAMGELGLFGAFVSEQYGGQELDYLSYIIAVEELARTDASQAATVAAANSLGIGPIYYFGTEEQKSKYLPRLCSGEMLWGFGLTEPNAGSDAADCDTHAVLDGDTWVMNGSKIFITNTSTDISGGVTVLAVTGKRDDGRNELSCFLVESGTPGYATQPMHGKMMWRASNTSTLYFEDCRVPKENLLGERGKGFHQMLTTLDGGRLSIGAMGLGGAQGCYDMAIKYAKERVQFVRPASSLQGLLAQGPKQALHQRSCHGKTLLFGSHGPGGQSCGTASRRLWLDERIRRGTLLP